MSVMYWKSCLLSLLMCGVVPVAACAGSMVKPDLTGIWGGEHIRLVVKETRAEVEYDCAFGTIDEALLPDKDGNFKAHGTHMFERGGPRRVGEPRPAQNPALYRGWTNGKEMRLTVTLPDAGKEVGAFTLELGRSAHLDKCL